MVVAVALGILGGCAAVSDKARPVSPTPSRRYTILALGTLGGSQTFVHSANSNGDVAGRFQTADGRWKAFASHAGKLRPIRVHGDWESAGLLINGNGEVAGVAGPDLYGPSSVEKGEAFLVFGGSVHILPGLGGESSHPYAVNARGMVVGASSVSGLYLLHPVLWRDGKATDLDPNTIAASARAVNNKGEIAGTGGKGVFLWRAGRLSRVPTSPGSHAVRFWLDDRGDLLMEEVSGILVNPIERGILHGSGRTVDIGSLGGASTEPADMGVDGTIVGQSQTAKAVWHGFVWKSGQMRDLGLPDGFKEIQPYRLGGRGEVAGLLGRAEGDLRDRKGVPFLYQGGRFWCFGVDPATSKDWRLLRIVAVGPGGKLVANGLLHGKQRACWLVPERSGV